MEGNEKSGDKKLADILKKDIDRNPHNFIGAIVRES
jgi:hypothetical protein